METKAVYRSSGKLGRGLAGLLAAALALGGLAGVLYGYSCYYCIAWLGSQKLSAAVAMLLFMGLGAGVYKAAKLAHCRNMAVVILAGLISGLLALYVSWATFAKVLLESGGGTVPLLDALTDPSALWSFIKDLNETGWYSKGYSKSQATEKGGILWAAWAGEALLAAGLTPGCAVFLWRVEVYCEVCGVWCSVKRDVAKRKAGSAPALEARIKEGDLTALEGLPVAADEKETCYRVDQNLCPQCGNTGTYRVLKITSAGAGGKKGSDSQTLNFLLDAEAASTLGRLAGGSVKG